MICYSYFFHYISSVCFSHTHTFHCQHTLQKQHFARVWHWSQSRQTRILCETWLLLISLFITLPVRSPTLISAPHQLLPCAPPSGLCVCMNIDVNYLLPQNRCSSCDFLEELAHGAHTRAHVHTCRVGYRKNEFLLHSLTEAKPCGSAAF